MIDEQSAALGKVLGVKVIISGSLLKLQDAIDINARVISVENGAIIAAENIRSSAKSDLHALGRRVDRPHSPQFSVDRLRG
jgi:TolB-like protein